MLTIIIFLVLAGLIIKIIFSGAAKPLPKQRYEATNEQAQPTPEVSQARTVTYLNPKGNYSLLYADALNQPHLLIAGATCSGKTVVENGLIYTLLLRHPFDEPDDAQLILLDPKGNELYKYRNLPHTLYYADTEESMVDALRYAVQLMEERQVKMRQYEDTDYYPGSDVYVFIDEFADLMTTRKKDVQPLVQRLGQRGRSARVHVILCTQTPISTVIPTEIKCNFDARFGLRTRSAQDSRNIIGISGLEDYPVYGVGYYMRPKLREDEPISEGKYEIPYVSKEDIKNRIDWWYDQMRQNGIDPNSV